MNINSVLQFGHMHVQEAIADLPYALWDTPVVGNWSVKEIIAHMASYEHLLTDVVRSITSGVEMPLVKRVSTDGQAFNEIEVERRQGWSVEAVWDDYQAAHEQAKMAVTHLSPEIIRTRGILPWYGPEYDLEDFIVSVYLGHKREHASQIAVYSDQFVTV